MWIESGSSADRPVSHIVYAFECKLICVTFASVDGPSDICYVEYASCIAYVDRPSDICYVEYASCIAYVDCAELLALF